jgi:hypothetical protein
VFDRDLFSFDATATLHSHACLQCLDGTEKLYCGKYEEVGFHRRGLCGVGGGRKKLREDLKVSTYALL